MYIKRTSSMGYVFSAHLVKVGKRRPVRFQGIQSEMFAFLHNFSELMS